MSGWQRGYKTSSHHTQNLCVRKTTSPRNDTCRNQTLGAFTSASHGRCPFRNQHAIGNYIVDFCSPRRKLIIELDGSQHLEQEEYDEERSAFLKSKGYKVLCFWNNDVLSNIDSVLTVIWDTLKEQD